MRRIFAIVVGLAVALGFAAPAAADETRLIFTTISPAGSTTSDKLLHPWADRVNQPAKVPMPIARWLTRSANTRRNSRSGNRAAEARPTHPAAQQ